MLGRRRSLDCQFVCVMGNFGRSSHLTPPVNASDARSFRAGALPSMIQFTLGILRWNQESQSVMDFEF